MPHTKNGRYYKIVNGKRQYNPKFDKKPLVLHGKGSYAGSAESTYHRTKKSRKAAKAAGNYEPSFGRSLLTDGGSFLGGLVGMPGLGKSAGGLVSNILGLGDYEIKENVFMEGRLPQVVNVPKAGGTVIRFQEYLSDIYTTADIANPDAFNIQTFLINAANPVTFPWLSQIAQNYEQYSFEGLLFQFKSTSADALNSTNTALGSVMLATQYDVADDVFATKAEMLNYEYSNSIKPSDCCMHMIECAPGQTPVSELYTLNGAQPANTDARLFHLGRFAIATVGFQAANVNIGELHVTYQVRLMKPKIYQSIGNGIEYAYLSSTVYSNAQPLDDSLALSADSTLQAYVSGGTLVIPASSVVKTYHIEVIWTGSTAAVIDPIYSNLTVANCTLGTNGMVPKNGDTAKVAESEFSITTKGNSKVASMSFSTTVLPAAPAFCQVRIMQVPQGSANP